MAELPSSSMPNSELCQVCLKNEVKYNCPRCSILYCSLSCYKSPSHSKCSEAFYKECVHQELKLQKAAAEPTDENVKRMIDILGRMDYGEDFENLENIEDEPIDESDLDELDSDDEDTTTADLAERLNGIDLDDSEAIWNQLTASEKKKFELLVHSDNLEKFVPIYKPWWEQIIKKTTHLVEEVSNATIEENSNNINSPKVIDQIIEFEKLSNKPPAECNYYNLINILGSYSQMVRFYNGDHFDEPKESVTYFSRVCGNFKSNTNYSSESNAIESIYHDCNLEGFAVDDKTVFTLKSDLKSLLNGPYSNNKTNLYVLAGLSDLYRLFVAAKNWETNKSNMDNKANGDFGKKFSVNENISSKLIKKSKLNIFIKKVEYYLAYVNKFL